MRLRQLAWRATYELLGSRVRRPEWSFMNYGYAGGTPLTLDPADEPDRFCIQLYAHVLDGLDVSGTDVLEVGSGRGGGASWISRTLGPSTTTGVDFASSAVDLSRRDRTGPGLRFVQGDAQALPFPDASFDVVVNVESSHCYASMEAFVAEAHRVLRPAGSFVWADLRGADDVATTRAQLMSSGLVPVEERDITAEVLAALRLDDDRKSELVREWIPRPFQRALRPFAGLEGTRNPEGFAAGTLRYLSARLDRPA
ncbi:class I SAM-dependent methyltransferase [Cellulomonas terrae]|uniref:Phthiotriol/phenolphthiotriol dimycocerosates methyltransferase n=1 Tax=Cellulomonas terrae TaxID=311234 RepID=A0A511JJL4_9CELL|nr:class I SAM-dependent methyltransferase [Cellulomonas terrae]GEL98202.1 phthiotriol/phenolphthiotriol dimycocerosates methyltransferase [Cellulomonas terrae]